MEDAVPGIAVVDSIARRHACASLAGVVVGPSRLSTSACSGLGLSDQKSGGGPQNHSKPIPLRFQERMPYASGHRVVGAGKYCVGEVSFGFESSRCGPDGIKVVQA